MEWQLNNDTPIYSQLVAHVQLGIVSGTYPPGDRLPSVRDMAMEAGVNPNTMQKALTELEREGLVFSQRTAGRFVTEDVKMIENVKHGLAEANIKNFFDAMSRLGYKPDEIISLLEDIVKEEKKNAVTGM